MSRGRQVAFASLPRRGRAVEAAAPAVEAGGRGYERSRCDVTSESAGAWTGHGHWDRSMVMPVAAGYAREWEAGASSRPDPEAALRRYARGGGPGHVRAAWALACPGTSRHGRRGRRGARAPRRRPLRRLHVRARRARPGGARSIGPAGRVLALDRDPEAVAAARALARSDPRVSVRHARFGEIGGIADAAASPAASMEW